MIQVVGNMESGEKMPRRLDPLASDEKKVKAPTQTLSQIEKYLSLSI
jgi:hypothetical protein